jgi:Tol biopolymer transport system component
MTLWRLLFATGLLVLLCVAWGHTADTELISVNNLGVPCGSLGTMGAPMLSGDGRYVAFSSDATELVPDDTNGSPDLFLRDRAEGLTRRVYVNATSGSTIIPAPNAGFSDDGRYLVVPAPVDLVPEDEYDLGPLQMGVFLYDVELGTFEMVSLGDSEQTPNDSSKTSVPSPASHDATHVVFYSWASNLVPDDINGYVDVFVRDRSEGTTELISVSTSGEQGNHESEHPEISADGRFVAFSSFASNLVAADTGGECQVYVRDRVAGTTKLVSVSTSGATGNQDSYTADISGDGRFVVFRSEADNLVPGDTNGRMDVFVRDQVEGTTELVSVGMSGAHGNYSSQYGWITPDGRWVCFLSHSSNLVTGDTNNSADVFVRDRQEGSTARISLGNLGQEADDVMLPGGISHDGRYVGFVSEGDGMGVDPCSSFEWYHFVRDCEGYLDVPASHWAASEIGACTTAGIVSGYPDGSYQPGAAVTRDQMAVYVSRALAGGEENVPECTGVPTFPDVPETFWALDHVEYSVSQNVVAGYQDGNYYPGYQVTRDQMAVYVARSICDPTGEDGLADYVPADPRNFPDVASGFWSYKHVEYCVENGVVAGYLDGLYHPEIAVTRDQMAVYVARAFGLL